MRRGAIQDSLEAFRRGKQSKEAVRDKNSADELWQWSIWSTSPSEALIWSKRRAQEQEVASSHCSINDVSDVCFCFGGAAFLADLAFRRGVVKPRTWSLKETVLCRCMVFSVRISVYKESMHAFASVRCLIVRSFPA